MNKKQLTQLFARTARRSPARAADDIDALMHRLLKEWKRSLERTSNERSTAAGSFSPKQDRQ